MTCFFVSQSDQTDDGLDNSLRLSACVSCDPDTPFAITFSSISTHLCRWQKNWSLSVYPESGFEAICSFFSWYYLCFTDNICWLVSARVRPENPYVVRSRTGITQTWVITFIWGSGVQQLHCLVQCEGMLHLMIRAKLLTRQRALSCDGFFCFVLFYNLLTTEFEIKYGNI